MKNIGNNAAKMKPSLANHRTRSKNVNNNNSESIGNSIPAFPNEPMDKLDDFGEIRPQVTCEGYGLRTPYGTHFNLDFLQYCQNIAEDQSDRISSSSRRSSSSSQRGSSFTHDFTSEVTGSDRNLSSPDSRADAERNVWETRRRLDAFRSYRKKTPNIAERRQYSSTFLKYAPKNSTNVGKEEKMLEMGMSSPHMPATSANNVQFPQQNLQAMREQMAAALSRLKYLENEVKQVQVLQVQISVLQQEKRKLSTELKMCREVSLQNARCTPKASTIKPSSKSSAGIISPIVSSGLLSTPPTPPWRKYKSVAVGPDSMPSMLQSRYDPGPDMKTKDACVGNTEAALEAKCTMTEQIELCNTSTSSFDLIKSSSICCGNHVEVCDNDSQYPKFQIKNTGVKVCTADFASDASSQTLVAVNNKATETRRDVIVKNKVDCKDVSVGNEITFSVIPVKRSISTTTQLLEFANQSINTERTQTVEKSNLCKPENADFECLVDIRRSLQSTATETVTVSKMNRATITDNFAPSIAERGINTDAILKINKSLSFRPDSANFGCNVRVHSGITVSTSTEKIAVTDSASNTETILRCNFATQTNPMVVFDAGILTKILPPQADACVSTDKDVLKVPSADSITQTDLNVLRDWYERTLNLKSCSDAATDTFGLKKTFSMQNIHKEIGEYVGQVESLLEEQQSLLSGRYEDFSDVLECNNTGISQHINQPQIQIEPKQKSSPQLIEGLDVFAKDERYSLPIELRLACEAIVNRHENEEDTSAELEALEVLTEEWFLISTLQESRPDLIKDFILEMRSLSPVVLGRVINSLDETGNSALHYAVSHENFGLVYTLTDIPELDIDQYNNAGYTASMLAAIIRIETKFEAQVMAALYQRANVSLHARQAGQTALMLAVSHGCVPAAKLLLTAGAGINAQDEDGSTALMCATEHGHTELVKLLLAHPDCNPEIGDNEGSAAIDIAMDSGQRDIAVLLYMQLNLDKSRAYEVLQ